MCVRASVCIVAFRHARPGRPDRYGGTQASSPRTLAATQEHRQNVPYPFYYSISLFRTPFLLQTRHIRSSGTGACVPLSTSISTSHHTAFRLAVPCFKFPILVLAPISLINPYLFLCDCYYYNVENLYLNDCIVLESIIQFPSHPSSVCL